VAVKLETMSGAADRGADSRGQSEVVGFVLLIAIATIGITGIVVLGSAAVDDSRHAMEVGSAEHAFTEFDSQASLVAHGAGTSQVAELPTGRNQRVQVQSDVGRMTVEVFNETGSLNATLLNTSLGAVKYTNGETTIAYQGGGVWKHRDDGVSTMISPPEVHYDDNTLTLPLVTVRGDGDVGGAVDVTQADRTRSVFPNATHTNPLEGGDVVITVRSDYYEAWGRFFESRIGGTISYDHEARTVTVELVQETSNPGVVGGIISGASAEELEFQNQGGVDSYNSSEGDYASTVQQNTTIVAAGSVTLGNKALVEGDVIAGTDLSMYNQATIEGDASYGGSLSMDQKATVTGTIDDDASVRTPRAVDYLIDSRLGNYSSTNDNDAASAIDNSTNALTGCSATCTIENGRYYLSEIDLSTGDELVFDTTDGSIEVAVDGPISVSGDARIEVQGTGTVRLYPDRHVTLRNDAAVSIPNQTSSRFWVYLRSDTSVDIDNKARFVGVLYGPGQGSTAGATIDVDNQAEVVGALVGRVPAIPNGVAVHFDEFLRTSEPLKPVYGDTPRVTYLHVSATPVNVTAA
jgi:hypothetical protein